jgi:hypothetical protein
MVIRIKMEAIELKKTKWEYHMALSFDELHLLGRQGWELVGVSGTGQGSQEQGDGDTFYLKRPCPSIREEITAEQRNRVLTERQGSE